MIAHAETGGRVVVAVAPRRVDHCIQIRGDGADGVESDKEVDRGGARDSQTANVPLQTLVHRRRPALLLHPQAQNQRRRTTDRGGAAHGQGLDGAGHAFHAVVVAFEQVPNLGGRQLTLIEQVQSVVVNEEGLQGRSCRALCRPWSNRHLEARGSSDESVAPSK